MEGAYEAQRAIFSAVAEALNVTISLGRFTVEYGLVADLDVTELMTEMTQEVATHEPAGERSKAVQDSLDEMQSAVARLIETIVETAETVVREEGVGHG